MRSAAVHLGRRILTRVDVWRTRHTHVLAIVIAAVAVGGSSLPALGAQDQASPTDCVAAAGDPEPGTPAWHARDAQNVYCAERRLVDAARHPVAPLPASMPVSDPYRDPALHDGTRFRFLATTVTNRDGQELAVELYLPCGRDTCRERPEGLAAFSPPYPAVLVQHGGYQSRKELHRWATQSLAEAGYMTVALDAIHDDDEFFEDATDVLNWLTATPENPTAAGEHNPNWDALDRTRIGVAGHSGGGATANRLGGEDPRISAVVTWDRSGRYDLPDELRVPSLYLIADHGFTPERRSEPPNPDGYEHGEHDPGDKWQDFAQARAQGIDSMKIVLRAATHLDWVPLVAAASQYGEAVSAYYTLAWFDRYLKGPVDEAVARDAFRRLTAPRFDDSYDRHNISQGFYDPAQHATSADLYGGNVPYYLEGLPSADRLSFYYHSKCFLTAPASKVRFTSDNLRDNRCTLVTAPATGDEDGGQQPAVDERDAEGPARLPATGGGAGPLVFALLAAAWVAAHRRR